MLYHWVWRAKQTPLGLIAELDIILHNLLKGAFIIVNKKYIWKYTACQPTFFWD